MKVADEELALAHADLDEHGFCMISEGKRVPPEKWDEHFATLPGIAELGDTTGDQLDDVPF